MGQKRHLHLLVIIAAVILSMPLFSFAGDFRVVQVSSGDSIKIAGHDIEVYVKLAGIDAPEMPSWKIKQEQPFSKQAKTCLSDRISGMTVDVIGYGMGPFNQVVGLVYLNGRNINLEIIQAGLAETDPEFLPRHFDMKPFLDAEAEAKKAKRGMWAQGEKYVSPKKWREMNSGKKPE